MERIAVLMSTYNGEKYIKEQVESILSQKCNCKISLIIRDDASSDSTLEILKKYDDYISVSTGENMGIAKSFMQLLINNPGYDYYAFADQDDIWYEDKLQRAINAISASKNYAMYRSNVRICDSMLIPIGRNMHGDLYVQNEEAVLLGINYTQGCTCVFNRKLADLIIEKGIPDNIVYHDFYIAMLSYLIRAELVYDKNPSMDYRVHNSNASGMVNLSQHGLVMILKNRIDQIARPFKVLPTLQLSEIIEKYSDVIPEEKIRKANEVLESKHHLAARFKYAFSPICKAESVNLSITNKLRILAGNY